MFKMVTPLLPVTAKAVSEGMKGNWACGDMLVLEKPVCFFHV